MLNRCREVVSEMIPGSTAGFVLRTKFKLQGAGHEESLDTLSLVFLGACR